MNFIPPSMHVNTQLLKLLGLIVVLTITKHSYSHRLNALLIVSLYKQSATLTFPTKTPPSPSLSLPLSPSLCFLCFKNRDGGASQRRAGANKPTSGT